MFKDYDGVKCEKSKELGQHHLSKEECKQCALSGVNPCQLRPGIIKQMWGNGDGRGNNTNFTPSQLGGCVRRKWYEYNNSKRYFDPKNAWNSFRGTMCHTFLEGVEPGEDVLKSIAEVRLCMLIDTKHGKQVFSGKFDLVEVLEIDEDNQQLVVRLVDWKSTRKIDHSFIAAKEQHQRQINLYAYLLRNVLPFAIQLYSDTDRLTVEGFNDALAAFKAVYKRDPDAVMDQQLLPPRRLPTWTVKVDEMQLVYFDMSTVRTFSSKHELKFDRGKLLTPRSAKNYEALLLEPIQISEDEPMLRHIVKCIEYEIDGRHKRAVPLFGEASRVCDYCPFQEECMNDWNETGS